MDDIFGSIVLESQKRIILCCFWGESLQMVLESPSNAMSYGTGVPHDVVLTSMLGV
jgi:hypothetical protein